MASILQPHSPTAMRMVDELSVYQQKKKKLQFLRKCFKAFVMVNIQLRANFKHKSHFEVWQLNNLGSHEYTG
jgi:hypothetical protein